MKVKTVLYTIYSEMYLRQKIRVEKNYSDMTQAVILFISRIFLVVCSPMQEHIDKLEFVDIKASVFRSRFHKRSY